MTPVARTTASTPIGSATPAYTRPEPIVLPATAKNWPGVPMTVTVTADPGVTTVSDTIISTL
jgi:hypothetical protein